MVNNLKSTSSSSDQPIEEEVNKKLTYEEVKSANSINANSGSIGITDEVETRKENVNFTEGGVENYKFYPDNPENHRHKYRWVHKEPTKFYDPCEQSRQASMNCVLRNQDDRSVCKDFFDAYKDCRKDFFNKKKKDKLEGKGGWGFW